MNSNDEEQKKNRNLNATATYGKKESKYGYWMNFKNFINEMEVYQIFAVRAKRRFSSRAMLGMIYLLSIFGYVSFIQSMNLPVKSENLYTESGKFKDYIRGGRYSRDKIIIENSSGIVDRYDIVLSSEEETSIYKIKGESIVVYYELKTNPFFLKQKRAKAIKYKDEFFLNVIII